MLNTEHIDNSFKRTFYVVVRWIRHVTSSTN